MLRIAERFYSIQGEGRYAGSPAYFVRLSGCNFLCNWLKKDGTRELCDTANVWKNTKEEISPIDLIRELQNKLHPNTHIIITGGEPLLQRDALLQFLTNCNFFTELETNGSIPSSKYFAFSHINWSPKFKSAGYGIEYYRKLGMVDFWRDLARKLPLDMKVVIANEKDLEELQAWQEELKFPSTRIFLMPVSNTRKELEENSKWVVEICKQHAYNFSPRLQLLIWGKTTGV